MPNFVSNLHLNPIAPTLAVIPEKILHIAANEKFLHNWSTDWASRLRKK